MCRCETRLQKNAYLLCVWDSSEYLRIYYVPFETRWQADVYQIRVWISPEIPILRPLLRQASRGACNELTIQEDTSSCSRWADDPGRYIFVLAVSGRSRKINHCDTASNRESLHTRPQWKFFDVQYAQPYRLTTDTKVKYTHSHEKSLTLEANVQHTEIYTRFGHKHKEWAYQNARSVLTTDTKIEFTEMQEIGHRQQIKHTYKHENLTTQSRIEHTKMHSTYWPRKQTSSALECTEYLVTDAKIKNTNTHKIWTTETPMKHTYSQEIFGLTYKDHVYKRARVLAWIQKSHTYSHEIFGHKTWIENT